MIKQIESLQYDAKLKEEGFGQILKYGIAFYKKDCEVIGGEKSK